jgi:hypothetical protein
MSKPRARLAGVWIAKVPIVRIVDRRYRAVKFTVKQISNLKWSGVSSPLPCNGSRRIEP